MPPDNTNKYNINPTPPTVPDVKANCIYPVKDKCPVNNHRLTKNIIY